MVQERLLKDFIWVIIISMNLFMTMSIINLWVSCRPAKRAFNASVLGVCWPINVITDYATFSAGKLVPRTWALVSGIQEDANKSCCLSLKAYSAAMDFTLALFPLEVLIPMNMRKAEKFGISVAMSMGIL